MSVILVTTLFYKALILQGEIWCWSLSGLIESMQFQKTAVQARCLLKQGCYRICRGIPAIPYRFGAPLGHKLVKVQLAKYSIYK